MKVRPQYIRSMIDLGLSRSTDYLNRSSKTNSGLLSVVNGHRSLPHAVRSFSDNSFKDEAISFVKENAKKGFGRTVEIAAGGMAAGLAYYGISSYIPEEFEEYIEKKLEFKRPRIVIEPEPFDSKRYVARRGAYELEQDFEAKRSANAPTMLSLIGPSGSGKSEMAAECAYNYSDKLAKQYIGYDRVVYILHAENPEVLDGEYRKLAARLGIFSDKQTLEGQMEEIRNGVNAILRNHSKWMLVFDNVTDYEEIRGYLPLEGKGRILTTSQRRLPGFAEDRTVDILSSRYSFTEDEAIELFQKHNSSIRDEEKIKQLTRCLMYLPLAINRAAVLCNKGTKLQELIDDLSNRFSPSKRNADQINSHINKMIIKELSSGAKAMLAVMAYSNPDYADSIDRMDFDISVLAEELFGSKASKTKDEIMMELRGFGLITGSKGYKNHRAMKKSIVEWMQDTEKKQEAAIELKILTQLSALVYNKLSMSNYFTTDVTSNNPFLPHIFSFFTHIEGFYKRYGYMYPDESLELYLKGISYLNKMATNMIAYNPEYAKKCLNIARMKCEQLCLDRTGSEIITLSNVNYILALDLIKQITSIEGRIRTGDIKSYLDFRSILDTFGKLSLVHEYLPDLYASILYQLGRTYFHTQKASEFISSVTFLTNASVLSKFSEQKALGLKPRNYQETVNPYDENRYGIAFRDNALYFLYLDERTYRAQEGYVKTIAERISDLREVIKLYEDSINVELNQKRSFSPEALNFPGNRIKLRNNRTIVTCYSQQLRAYQELCLVDPNRKRKYLSQMDELFHKIEMVVGSTLIDSKATQPDINNLKKLLNNEYLQESDISDIQRNFKKSNFYLDRGQYFILKEDFDKAKQYFLTVIQEGSDVTRRIDAYKGLLSSILQVQKIGVNCLLTVQTQENLEEAFTVVEEFKKEGLFSHPRSEDMEVIMSKLENEMYQRREITEGLMR